MKSFYVKLLSVTLISCLGIIAYSNAFQCSFHLDDNLYITNNSAIRDFHELQGIWKFYPCRLITFLSFVLNYHFNGLHVFGYHLFNLAVHLGSAILVWWLTLLTLSTPAMKENRIARHAEIIALFAGLVFVSHPVQTEAVTYIWQRTASMAALFYLASLCFYVKSRLLVDQGKRPYTCYILSLIAAVLAMFTKEITITLPLMILLYEFSFLRTKQNSNWKYLAPFLLTLFIIPLTILLLPESIKLQEAQGVIEGLHNISPMHYLLTQFRVMITYIRLIFFPFNQNLDYDYPIFKSIFEFPVLISLLFLMAILYWAKLLFSKYRILSFSVFWFFLALLPESSVFPLKDVIFEHRLYLPLVGYSIFLVSGLYYLLGKHSLRMMGIVLTGIIICYSLLTYQRNEVWKNNLTLWNDTVGKSPNKARPHNNRANAYLEQGNIAQAMLDFNKAIELNPGNEVLYYNRGIAYTKQGDLTQAISDFSKAIKLSSDYADAYANRALMYLKLGDFIQAISDFTKAIEISPKNAGFYNYRGVVYGEAIKFPQAISDFTKAIEINPKYKVAYYNRAGSYYHLKKYDKVWADIQRSEELGYAVDPGFISALKRVSGRDK